MATQAMALFSNLTYPNLKAEIPDLKERSKHISKLWRKLDGPTKLIYVNKSRQNRYKKKSDDKVKSVGSKRPKSPANSDRQSDAEFSRSATPSTNLESENAYQNGDSEKLRQSHGQVISLNNHNSGQFISQLSVNKVASASADNNEKIILSLSQANQPPKIIQLTNNQGIIDTSGNSGAKNPIFMYQMQQNQAQTMFEPNNNINILQGQNATQFKVLDSYKQQGLSANYNFYFIN